MLNAVGARARDRRHHDLAGSSSSSGLVLFLVTLGRAGSATRAREIDELPLEHRYALSSARTAPIDFRRRGRGRAARRVVAGAPASRSATPQAFAAHLERGRRERPRRRLRLGREAVAAQYSVLDFAEAHHARAARRARRRAAGRQGEIVPRPPRSSCARACRCSRSPHRGYHEVQEVARIEHEYVEQLRALADASVAINSSLSVEEILQLTADAARAVLGARRATVAIISRRTRGAPPLGRDVAAASSRPARRHRRALERRRCSAQRRELGDARGRRPPRSASSRARDDAILTQLGQLAVGGDRQRAALRPRAHDRAHAAALAAAGRAARRRPAWRPPCASAPPARASSSAATSTTSTRARRRLGGADRRHPGQGPRGRRGHRARPPHAARRAPPTSTAPAACSRCCTARCASSAPTAASAPSPTPTCRSRRGHVRLELACGGHPLPLVVHPDGSVEPVGRLGTLLGSDIEPLLDRRRRRARAGRRARPLHRRRDRGPAPPPRGVRPPRADRAAARRAAACRPTRSPSASRRPCSPPPRAGCATTWRSWPRARRPAPRLHASRPPTTGGDDG